MRWLALVWVASLAVLVAPVQARQRSDGSVPAPAQIAQLVTSVPAKTLDQVGAGNINGPRHWGVFKLPGHLTSQGKPEVFTMNIAWCPHCAANSWALAVALSRFGTLTGLRVVDTGTHYCVLAHDPCVLKPFPCFPHTHGLSFLDASFRSSYLSFAHIVLQDVAGHNLEHPTRQEGRVVERFDPGHGTPALDVGGAYGFGGPGYDPGTLAGKTWSQIATSLGDPHTAIARRVDGLANLFTAAMCKVTGGHPRSVCTSRGVRAAAAAHLRSAAPPPPPGPGP